MQLNLSGHIDTLTTHFYIHLFHSVHVRYFHRGDTEITHSSAVCVFILLELTV